MAKTVVIKPSAATFTSSASSTASKPQYTAAKTWEYVGGTFQSFVHWPMPSDLRGKIVLEAYATIVGYPSAGSRTLYIGRHAKSTTAYSKMHANNDPGLFAGAVEQSLTQDPSVDNKFVFDMMDDVAIIRSLGNNPGFRLRSTHGSKWGLYGWTTAKAPTLTIVYADAAEIPTNLGPDGITNLAAPVLTWVTPEGMLSARAQVTAVPAEGDEPDWSSPIFDTGTVPTEVAQLDLATAGGGWAGQSNGQSKVAHVMHTTTGGPSQWSEPITITRRTRNALTLDALSATDPTPTGTWAMTGQKSYQYILRVDGVVVHNSGELPGTDVAYSPPATAKGATKAGQSVVVEVRGWNQYDYTPSPGDPGYSSHSRSMVYAPGSAAAVTGLTATQDGNKPWTDLAWNAPPSGSPDEWQILRDNGIERTIVERIPAVDDDGAVLSYRDWGCPPNTDVTYYVRPLENGAAGQLGTGASTRTRVTGAWLFEPVVDGPYFWVKAGDDLAPAHTESSVWYTPTGGDHDVKRTFALRGQTLDPFGRLTTDGPDPRPITEQLRDVYALKSRPAAQLRCAWGDQNVPCVVSDIDPQMHNALSTHERIAKTVRFHARQNGELPFEPVAAP